MVSADRLRRALAIIGLCAWLALLLVIPDFFSRWSGWAGRISAGVLLGTFFGGTTLSAMWLVFGRKGYARRIGRWLACCLAIMAAMTVNCLVSIMPMGRVVPMSALFGAVAAVQSGLIAGLLWILGKTTGAHLRHLDELPSDILGADQQFGIRAVLIATGLIAAVLSGIRWALDLNIPESSPDRRGIVIFGFLVLCNLFVVLPLIIGPLLRRFALTSTLAALGFVGLITALEVSGINQIERGAANAWSILLLLNYAQAGWVLLALCFVRRAGYRLSAAIPVSPRPGAFAATPP